MCVAITTDSSSLGDVRDGDVATAAHGLQKGVDDLTTVRLQGHLTQNIRLQYTVSSVILWARNFVV